MGQDGVVGRPVAMSKIWQVEAVLPKGEPGDRSSMWRSDHPPG